MLWTHDERWLFRSDTISIGVLEVPADHEAWHGPCNTPAKPQVAFPMRAIRTAVEGEPGTDRIISPLHAMRSSPGWIYRRSLVHAGGERSGVFQIESSDALGAAGVAPVSAAVFVWQRELIRSLLRGDRIDALDVEERALDIVRAASAAEPLEARRPERADTAEAHDDACRRALELIEHSRGRPLTMAEFGRHVHLSPAHFARVFRRRTGFSLADACKQRRLRGAAEDVLNTADPLQQIAMRWGFGDMPHFSRSFRAAFGRTASSFRS